MQETEVDKTEMEATESTNTGYWKQTFSKSSPSSLPKCTNQNIQQIIDKYEIVFVGEGKLNTQQANCTLMKKLNPWFSHRGKYHLRREVSKELKNWVTKTSSKSVTSLCRGYRQSFVSPKRMVARISVLI